MESLLLNLYESFLNFRSKYPNLFFSSLVIVVLGLSLLIFPKFTNLTLIKDEPSVTVQKETPAPTMFEGKVSYVGKVGNTVSYELLDSANKSIALLRSNDSRLQIVEGLHVKIRGEFLKSEDGSPNVIVVKEVIIQNDTSN